MSVATIDVSDAQGASSYDLTAAGANLTLSHDDGSGYVVSQTIAVAAMGANASQALAFDRLGVTIDLTHDAQSGLVRLARERLYDARQAYNEQRKAG